MVFALVFFGNNECIEKGIKYARSTGENNFISGKWNESVSRLHARVHLL